MLHKGRENSYWRIGSRSGYLAAVPIAARK
jgi:hypothetical protein